MRRALAIVMWAALPAGASAQSGMSSPPATQSNFQRMRARVGDVLYVTDPDRRVKVSGRVTSLSDQELTIDGYHFTPRPGLKIERGGDSIWDGATLGFLLGGVAGVTVGAEGCLNRSMTPCVLGNAVMLGALGAYVDWQHKGRTVIFLGGPEVSNRPPSDPGQPTLAEPTAFDFQGLGLKRGDHVAITALDGTQTTGPITTLNRDAFRVGSVDLSRTSPILVERIGDSIWNGAAYGAAFAVMASVAGETGVRAAATTAVIYGSIGAIVDGCVKGRTTVYGRTDPLGRPSSLRLVPDIGPTRKGAALIVRF
jgi:hypothetical protein